MPAEALLVIGPRTLVIGSRSLITRRRTLVVRRRSLVTRRRTLITRRRTLLAGSAMPLSWSVIVIWRRSRLSGVNPRLPVLGAGGGAWTGSLIGLVDQPQPASAASLDLARRHPGV